MDSQAPCLAKQIRTARKRARLTICELAELAEIDPGFLACIETAKKAPSLATLGKLSRALNLPLHHLVMDRLPPAKDPHYDAVMRLAAILRSRTAGEREDVLFILRFLKPRKARALRELIG